MGMLTGLVGAAPAEVIEAAASATPDERALELRIFLVVQHGLAMGDACMASAAARATWMTLRAAMRTTPERVAAYDDHIQPKISLRARNEASLLRARAEAYAAGLPAALAEVADRLPAVLGIGPALRSDLPKFVQKLQLLTGDPGADATPVADPDAPMGEAMWILVRRDLGIPYGKLAAQSGHGCWTAGRIAMASDPGAVERWEEAGCPVGVLWLDGIGAMDAAHEAATRQGLASAYIVDAGRTEFSGPTPTVVGMGPCESAALPPQVRCLLDADGGVACPPRTGTA